MRKDHLFNGVSTAFQEAECFSNQSVGERLIEHTVHLAPHRQHGAGEEAPLPCAQVPVTVLHSFS